MGVEDRIYRSLRTAQERELQSRPSPAQAEATAARSVPSPEALESHVSSPSHAAIRPANPHGFRWFGRGFGSDRPRISIVGTLSLSVLISAGLFAAQMIVKPRHKRHAPDESVAADSNAAMRVAAHRADDAEDESGGLVSVPSRFRHVHPPAAHAKTHSTHAVALDEQVASDGNAEDSSDEPKNSAAAKKQHRPSANRSIQHAADDNETLQLDDVDGPPKPAVQASAAPGNHGTSQHDGTDQRLPAPTAAAPVPETVAAPSDRSPVQSNVRTGAGLSAFQAPAQPAMTTNSQSMDPSSKWPLVPSASPLPATSGAVQVSAEASNANTPSLTIVPGRPDNLSLPAAPPGGGRIQPFAQQPPIAPAAARFGEASTAHPGQTANASGAFQDRPDVAPAQPVANPFETLDRTKVMSFQFRNAPWPLVLAKFASATGLELRMQAMPDGTFNRWDAARYTPTQTLAILNSELAMIGCQAKIVGTALCVVPATTSDSTAPASASPTAVTPAAASSSQLPQYPGIPASATGTTGARQ